MEMFDTIAENYTGYNLAVKEAMGLAVDYPVVDTDSEESEEVESEDESESDESESDEDESENGK